MDAAQLLFAASLFSAVTFGFGAYVQVVLGDSFTVPFTENCTHKSAKLSVSEPYEKQVAVRDEQGLWRPAEGYRDRIPPNTSVHFNHTVINDGGKDYSLTCGSDVIIIHMDVVVAAEAAAKQGETVKLKCHYSTDEHVKAARWERNKELVFEQDFSTGQSKSGSGFEGNVSPSPSAHRHGDMSLIVKQVRPEDAGDYFCYVYVNGHTQRERGNPAAARLTVTEPSPDQTTTAPRTVCPTHPEVQALSPWTSAFIVAVTVIVGLSAFYLGRKCCRSRVSGPRGGEAPTDVETGLSTEIKPLSPETNGGHSVSVC